MMDVAIVDYGSGNLRSAAKAFERTIAEANAGGRTTVTSDPAAIRSASHIVLPGVGAFADCKQGLEAIPGMIEALAEAALKNAKPFLGICVGMQLLASRGLEHGVHDGLGWIEGDVVAIQPKDDALKIPHMGWNDLRVAQPHPLMAGIDAGAHAYFVHSYQFTPKDRAAIFATVDYGGEVVALVGRDNLAGTQFHPEKSQATGLALIANFLKWRP
ncbi:MAG: imidazole glycerol phosphate synthase subunit HisH [Rhodospirillales bacterium]|nr:imidazole glycerol phosphate synthase subunit HisH [Rhodospirillales bacterium]